MNLSRSLLTCSCSMWAMFQCIQDSYHLEAVGLGRGIPSGRVQNIVDEARVPAQLAQRVDGRERGRLGLALALSRSQQALRCVGAQKVLVQIALQVRGAAANHLHHLDERWTRVGVGQLTYIQCYVINATMSMS